MAGLSLDDPEILRALEEGRHRLAQLAAEFAAQGTLQAMKEMLQIRQVRS